MIEQFANRLAKKMVEEGRLQQNVGEIAHGLEIVILYTLNLAIILFFAYLGDCFLEVMVASFGYFLIRIFSGGAHFQGQWLCLFVGNASLFGLGWLAHTASPRPAAVSILVIAVTFLVSFLLNMKFAPVSSYGFDEAQREKNRKLIMALLSLGAAVSVLLVILGQQQAAFALAFSVLYQAVLLLPSVNKIVKQI